MEIDWDAVAGGDVQDATSLQLFGGTLQDLTLFLLWPQEPLVIEICQVSGFEKGHPIPGDVAARSEVITPGNAYMFGHTIPEGMPNLLACAKTKTQRLCWAPAFSGKDNSLMLSPGFGLHRKSK